MNILQFLGSIAVGLVALLFLYMLIRLGSLAFYKSKKEYDIWIHDRKGDEL